MAKVLPRQRKVEEDLFLGGPESKRGGGNEGVPATTALPRKASVNSSKKGVFIVWGNERHEDQGKQNAPPFPWVLCQNLPQNGRS